MDRQIGFLEAFGAMTFLSFESELHRNWYVYDLAVNFVPALQAGQVKIFFDEENGFPTAFVTWALLDDETHEKLLLDGITPPPEKWNSGEHLWFIDFLSPFGNPYKLIRELQLASFSGFETANFISRNSDGSIRKIRTWKSSLHKSEK